MSMDVKVSQQDITAVTQFPSGPLTFFTWVRRSKQKNKRLVSTIDSFDSNNAEE